MSAVEIEVQHRKQQIAVMTSVQIGERDDSFTFETIGAMARAPASAAAIPNINAIRSITWILREVWCVRIKEIENAATISAIEVYL